MIRSFRLVAALAALFLATALVPPGVSFARDLEFQASIIDHQPNLLIVKTSGNEVLQFDLGWFKNKDGYALKRDEFYCFQVQDQPNGKLMLISVETCEESRQRQAEAEENERDQDTAPA